VGRVDHGAPGTGEVRQSRDGTGLATGKQGGQHWLAALVQLEGHTRHHTAQTFHIATSPPCSTPRRTRQGRRWLVAWHGTPPPPGQGPTRSSAPPHLLLVHQLVQGVSCAACALAVALVADDGAAAQRQEQPRQALRGVWVGGGGKGANAGGVRWIKGTVSGRAIQCTNRWSCCSEWVAY
jgi:hypothetical protein